MNMDSRILHQNNITMDTNAKNISDITMPLVPTSAFFGRVVYQPASTLGPRIQDGLQLVGIESGHVTITVDGKRHDLPEGWMCLLLPGREEMFRFARRKTTCHNWCTMNFASIPLHFNMTLDALPFAVPMTPLIQSLIDWGLQARANPHSASQQMSVHLGQSLFYAWLSASQDATQIYPNPPAIELARVFIAQYYAKPIMLDDIADAANVSSNHLMRLFKTHLHTTPSRYLWQYRTQQGIDLLRHTGLSISQIALRVGFATPFHFSRLVKQAHDLSPRQLRDKLWKKP